MKIYNTPTIDNKNITQISMITEEVAVGVNVIRDIFAAFRDFFGGRSQSYEDAIANAKQDALNKLVGKAHDLQADAIVNLTFDIFTVGYKNAMICVSITGTAVKFVS
jgi:uncharacterized protein YbjQ (UPF0145 family)